MSNNTTTDPQHRTPAPDHTPDPLGHFIMQFFAYEHLPARLQAVSKPFCDLARAIVGDERGMPAGTSVEFPLPRNPETAVRATLAK